MAELFQFGAQFQVIVDFAVEDDYSVAIRREDRLIAALEVNNFQAGGAKRADFGLEDALLVRAAMDEGRRGAPDAVRIGRPIFMGETGDATQIPALLGVWVPSIVARVYRTVHIIDAPEQLQVWRGRQPSRYFLPRNTSVTPMQTRRTPSQRLRETRSPRKTWPPRAPAA